MKKNLVLSLILATLLLVAYFSEEVVKVNIEKNKKNSVRLIHSDTPILEIKTASYTLINIDGVWRDESINWKIDQELMLKVLDIFQNLYVSSKIETKKPDDYFNKHSQIISFKLGNSIKEFRFGPVSKITGGFYMQDLTNPNEVMICYDDSFMKVVYSNEVELDLKKYVRLLNLINASKFNFLEQNILSQLDLINLKKITIDSERNRWFQVNLERNSLNPKPPKKIKIKNIRKIISSGVKGLRVKKIINKGEMVLTDPMSKVKLFGEKVYLLTLYRKLNNKDGNYLRISGSDQILEVDLKKGNIFFINNQEFWDKTIDYGVVFSSLDRVDFTLRTQNAQNSYPFFIDDLEEFIVKSEHKKVGFISKVHMNLLFNLLLNLTDFKEAKFIEERITPEADSLDLYVTIFKKSLGIKVGADFIKVYDLKSGLVYNYSYNTRQIRPGFFEKIFTEK